MARIGPRIGDVWDDAVAVLAGRAGILTAIALAGFVLPAAAQAALRSYSDGGVAALTVGALIAIIGVVATLWGQLATVAVASDPATTRAMADRAAWRRLPALLLVVLVLGGLVVVLTLPIAAVLAANGVHVAAAAQGAATMPAIGPGAATLLVLYALALLALALWVSARLYLLHPVVLNEHKALGALGRSVALTRGYTLALIGVSLLFVLAGLVATTAARAVVGIVVRLLFGPGSVGTAAFLAAVAAACVTAAWIVVVQVFATRLWAALTGAAVPQAA